MIYQYRKLEENEQIVIGSDPAEGNDYCTFTAISKYKHDVVMVGRSQQESSQLGHELNHVGLWIKKRTNYAPTIAVERNVGSATIYVLKTLNYPEIFRMPQSFVKDDVVDSETYGWSTNSATRPKMLDDLALALRQKVLIIPSKLIIDELYTFIRHEKTGKAQADIGCHDDLVMALAITWQVYQISPSVENEDFSDIPDDTKWVQGL
jgi:hypothetical protein